ncbi:acyltransferase [Micromonospora yasonensis]|uniref:acyltransferase family protein n=1 Tax=Micromonospora yasonensis TaxID=1128667 RepID=UPI002231464F|nr:acyltransferase [Micromonospora yasonensis]MCW3839599.1 acyltransferase [Micromonospora yasonensis]
MLRVVSGTPDRLRDAAPVGSRPAATGAGSGARRDNCFDLLRLVAALGVAVQHAVAHLHTSFLWFAPGSDRWFGDGVPMFFIISGALVYASALRCRQQGRPWRDYFRNRLFRIAPALYAYAAVMVVFVLLAGVVDGRALAGTQFLGWLGSTLLFVPVYHPPLLAGFGTGVLNGSLWTIPVEVGFYLLVPALVRVAVRRSFAVMFAGAGIAAVCGVVLHAVAVDQDRLGTRLLAVSVLPWLGFFLLGMGWNRIWHRVPRSPLVAVVALVGYVATAVARRHLGGGAEVVLGLLGGVPLAYLVHWLAYHGGAVLRRLTDRIGDLSFGVYIWHMPVINLLLWVGLDRVPLHGTALVLLAIAGTACCALLSWHLVEKPALGLKSYSSRGLPLPADRPTLPRKRIP